MIESTKTTLLQQRRAIRQAAKDLEKEINHLSVDSEYWPEMVAQKEALLDAAITIARLEEWVEFLKDAK